MKKSERRIAKLMNLLQLKGQLTVKEACDALQTSEATTRRLFSDLQEQGRVIRTHGGVRPAASSYAYSYQQALHEHISTKRKIGRAAADQVVSGHSLFLDSGTTVFCMAEALAVRLQTGSLSEITIITNAFSVVDILANHCTVTLLGGETRLERRDVCGALAESNLSRFHPDAAYLGADAVHVEHGYMATDEKTARINEVIIPNSRATWILATSHKFNKTALVTYAAVGDVSNVISDQSLPKDQQGLFDKAGVKLVLA